MVPHVDTLSSCTCQRIVSICRQHFSLFVLSKSGIHCHMMLLQLIVFPCLFVVLNTQICLNLYLVKFNRFAHTCMERYFSSLLVFVYYNFNTFFSCVTMFYTQFVCFSMSRHSVLLGSC